MVRALFFLLIAFRVTVCPVVCASGGDLGYCCHGCAIQTSGGQKDECCDAKPASEHSEEHQAAGPGCQCCSQQDRREEDPACDRFAEERFVSGIGPIAPAGDDGMCNGDCACKVLPEKGKAQIDSRTCFALGSWNCADVGAYAIKCYAPSLDKLHAASPPDGKAVRIAHCSLLI